MAKGGRGRGRSKGAGAGAAVVGSETQLPSSEDNAHANYFDAIRGLGY